MTIWSTFLGFHKSPLVLMLPGRQKAIHFIDEKYKRVLSGFYFLHNDIDNILLIDGAPIHRTHKVEAPIWLEISDCSYSETRFALTKNTHRK
jgi:hypothetical protein